MIAGTTHFIIVVISIMHQYHWAPASYKWPSSANSFSCSSRCQKAFLFLLDLVSVLGATSSPSLTARIARWFIIYSCQVRLSCVGHLDNEYMLDSSVEHFKQLKLSCTAYALVSVLLICSPVEVYWRHASGQPSSYNFCVCTTTKWSSGSL